MKIVYLYQADGHSLSHSRAQTIHIFSIINALQRRGHSVKLMTLYGRQVTYTDDMGKIQEHSLEQGDFARLGTSSNKIFLFLESALRRLQRLLHLPYLALFDSFRIMDACRHTLSDTIIIHERLNLLSIGGSLASHIYKIPLVLEVNADLIQERSIRNRALRGVQHQYAVLTTRYSLDRARKIIAISHELKQRLVDHWLVPVEKIYVMPNAADGQLFNQMYDQEAIRRSLKFNDDPVIIFIGGFYVWHDLILLINSFQLALATFPNTRLLLVGDGETRVEIESYVSKLGIDSAVTFMGQVEFAKIPELLFVATIAVAPSKMIPSGNYHSPLKIFEYMAAGKAIIATQIGPVESILQHERNAILIDPGDTDGFANAIVRLLDDPVLVKKLGEQARKDATEKYSWNEYTRQLESIYQSVLSHPV